MRDDTDDRVPPRTGQRGQRIALKRLWHQLPAANRRDALRTLSRDPRTAAADASDSEGGRP